MEIVFKNLKKIKKTNRSCLDLFLKIKSKYKEIKILILKRNIRNK